MKLYSRQFLDCDPSLHAWEQSSIAILPLPYEGGVSYGKGTSKAPDSVIEASRYLETYDEVLEFEPIRSGISTLEPPPLKLEGRGILDCVYRYTQRILEQDKYLVLIGGDHSISSGFFKALKEIYGSLGVIQIDAHADLRNSYDGSPLSHACVMSRIREMTSHTLQIGIRSMSAEEARRIKEEDIRLVTMHEFRSGDFVLDDLIEDLPQRIFLTLDVDAFDLSLIHI